MQTVAITRVRDVVKFIGTHEKGWPYEFWSAMLDTPDRLVMLALADWLEERGADLYAAAWRWLFETDREPLWDKGHRQAWFREGDLAIHEYVSGWGWRNELGGLERDRAFLPGQVFDAMLCLEHSRDGLRVKPRVIYNDRGPWFSGGHGRADSLNRAALAKALTLAGFRALALTHDGRKPAWLGD